MRNILNTIEGKTGKRLFVFTFFLLIIIKTASSQDNLLTFKQMEVLRAQLQTEKTDTGKIKKSLRLAWFQILKPKELKSDLDSARTYLSTAARLLNQNPANENLGFYHLINADYYNECGQKKAGDAELDKAITYLKLGNDFYLLGSAYAEKMNRIDLSNTSAPLKIQLTQLAAAAFSKTTNKRKLGDCLRLLADLRIYMKDDRQVLQELDSAKHLYQEANSGDWQQLYILYSQYYQNTNNNEKSLENILNALRTTGPDDTSSDVFIRLQTYAGLLYARLNDFKQSLNCSLRALNAAKKKKDNPLSLYNVAYFVVRAYSKLGMANSGLVVLNRLEKDAPYNSNTLPYFYYLARMLNYADLKLYSKAQLYFNALSNQINSGVINRENHLALCYKEMIDFCIKSGQLKKADELFTKWQPIYDIMQTDVFVKKAFLESKIKLDIAKKDYKAASTRLLAANALNDSIFSATRARQMKELEFQYQTERKENENKLQQQKILNLTEQQNLEHAELEAAGVTKNVTMICALCLLAIAGLVYRQYVNGKKNNTIIAGKNHHLEHLLKENEFLMKEVHHRVKNNLQIVTSLLNSQSAYMNEGAALDAIMKSKGRVESIALIHQKLYKAESQTNIYMPEYIQELAKYLKDSFVDEQHIWFDVLTDEINLEVSDAVPIGLIINESVTNAIKHAFTNSIDKAANVIEISLRKIEAHLELTIRDNGKGFTAGKSSQNTSFGLILINGLSKDLGGKLKIYNDFGTVIQLSFTPTPLLTGLELLALQSQ